LAEGEKDQRVREADGYRLKRINEAEGDVARFSALLAQYIKAPELRAAASMSRPYRTLCRAYAPKSLSNERTRSILPFLNLDSQKADSQKADRP